MIIVTVRSLPSPFPPSQKLTSTQPAQWTHAAAQIAPLPKAELAPLNQGAKMLVLRRAAHTPRSGQKATGCGLEDAFHSNVSACMTTVCRLLRAWGRLSRPPRSWGRGRWMRRLPMRRSCRACRRACHRAFPLRLHHSTPHAHQTSIREKHTAAVTTAIDLHESKEKLQLPCQPEQLPGHTEQEKADAWSSQNQKDP